MDQYFRGIGTVTIANYILTLLFFNTGSRWGGGRNHSLGRGGGEWWALFSSPWILKDLWKMRQNILKWPKYASEHEQEGSNPADAASQTENPVKATLLFAPKAEIL